MLQAAPWLTPDEAAAAINFCTIFRDPFRGYRYLAWLMVDKDVAYIKPSTLYNLLKRNCLVSKWAKPTKEHKEGYVQPTHPNEEWHTASVWPKVDSKKYFL